MQTGLETGSSCEMADGKRTEGTGKAIGVDEEEVVKAKGELTTGTGCSSPAMGSSLFSSVVLVLDHSLYLSSPSQSVDLRPSSIWLCRAESFTAIWPTGCLPSVAMRTRKRACRTPSGHLFGPIGRLFDPSGQGRFRGGAGRCSSVYGTTVLPKRRTGHGCSACLPAARSPATALVCASPVASLVAAPAPSVVAAPLDLAAGLPLPMAARFAGLAICRHLYATSRSKHQVEPWRPGRALDFSSRTPRSRRHRYRLRAGSTTLRRFDATDHTWRDRNRLRAGEAAASRLRAGFAALRLRTAAA